MGVSISSDYDYLKYDEDTLLMTSGDSDSDFAFPNQVSPGSDLSVETIAHDFGIVPMARVFYNLNNSDVWYNTRQYDDDGNIVYPFISIIATSAQVKLGMFDNHSFSAQEVYYRIYDIGEKSVTSADLIDKVFYKSEELSTTVPAASGVGGFTPGVTTLTFPHGQGEIPLWHVQHSTNGEDWYPEGVRNVLGTGATPGFPREIEVYGYADDTNLYIRFLNLFTTSEVTVYYRYTLDYKI